MSTTIPTHIHAFPRHVDATKVYPEAVPVYDAVNKRVRVGDGTTAGGTVLPNMGDLANRGLGVTSLSLLRPASDSPLHLLLKKAGADGTLGNAATLIDTLNTAADREKVTFFDYSGTDGVWAACPGSGLLPTAERISVDLSSLDGSAILFYAWQTADGGLSDYASIRFPSCSEGGGGSGSPGRDGADGADGSNTVILCLCNQSPASLFDGMIWIKGGTDAPLYITAAGGVTVLTAAPENIAAQSNGTIIITEA